jgi:putative ABC transport system permease protein
MRFAVSAFIAIRHLKSRPFQAFSVISVIAFSVGLCVALASLAGGLQQGLAKAVEPFEIIVGAKGSPYQLVLNTVFFQDVPIGNLEWRDYAALSDDRRVGFVVPLAFGDSLKGYPVVGTTHEITRITTGEGAQWMRLGEGRWFEGEFEAVLGANVALESGLGVGAEFRTSHGVSEGNEHAHSYRVVGVAGRVSGPYDRAVLVGIRDIWEEHEGHMRGDSDAPRSHGDVTAMLVHPKSYADAYSLASSFQKNEEGQLTFPSQTVIRLFSMIGRGERFLSVVTYSVACCALLTTLMALYWSAAARGRERFLLRILGVPRRTLVFISWLEGMMALASGIALGELFGRLGARAAFYTLNAAAAIDAAAPVAIKDIALPSALLVSASLGCLIASLRSGRGHLG